MFKLNILGGILAALAGVGGFLKGFVPGHRFRGATLERTKKIRRQKLGGAVLERAFRSYQVRYTNVLSRRAAVNNLLRDCKGASERGQKALADRFVDRAVTFPW